MDDCLFCENAADSKEDAWPLWLIRKYSGVRSYVEVQRGNELSRWPADSPKIRIGCVCERCNHGWMSDLEGASKPLIERLLAGDRFGIDVPAQQTLTTWALKTVMVFEAFKNNQTLRYTRAERDAIARWRTIPDHTQVWLASCVDQPFFAVFQSDLGVATEDLVTTGFYSTIALRHGRNSGPYRED